MHINSDRIPPRRADKSRIFSTDQNHTRLDRGYLLFFSEELERGNVHDCNLGNKIVFSSTSSYSRLSIPRV